MKMLSKEVIFFTILERNLLIAGNFLLNLENSKNGLKIALTGISYELEIFF